MNQHYDAFRKKLQEIFMMDHAELDFGIYRIMNHKRNQINDFLDKQLLPQVEKTLQEYVKTDDSLQQELAKAIEGCKNLGIDPDSNPKVQQLRQQIAQSSTSIEDLQNTVFSRLTQFFSRYYEGGDFVSQRRYKSGGNSAYAIPYNGEEVKLYWANYDQYYIKTSEYFKNYTFRLRDGRRICFVLVDASTEQNNNKSTNGMERRFDILKNEEGQPVVEEADGELHISFTYELMPKATKQKDLNGKAFEALKAVIPSAWSDLLTKEQVTDSSVLLEKHINAYTAKNSFDYFIHKDLGGFLNRELDFYLKNEVVVIADLDAAKLQSQLAIVKAIEKVGKKIIDFLAQLENFQKRLWLKKKFVVQSDYCITLDRVPEKFYQEICDNDDQRREWVRLFAIDEIKGDGLFTKGYSEPLTIDFLKQNPFLVLDTKFFSLQFKHKLIAEIEDLDEQTNGLLINSENFQALELLQEKYRQSIKCIYADPPYNTSASEIAYKNSYKNSSWLSLMYDRLELGKQLLSDEGIQCTTIDDVEQTKLGLLLEDVFEEQPEVVAIRIKPSGRPIPNGFAISHEYALFSKKQESVAISRLSRSDEQLARYRERDEKGPFFWEMLRKAGSNSHRDNRPTMFYPIYWNKAQGSFRLPNMEYSEERKAYIVDEEPSQEETVVYPIKDDGSKGCWYFGIDNIKDHIGYLKAEIQQSGITYVYYRRRPNEGVQPLTTWGDAKYSATEHGTDLLKKMAIPFDYPKSIHAVEDCLRVSGCHRDAIVLDYFGGSGTTSHAIINLNKIDEGCRKYILCDMAEYFHPALRTRTERAIYSDSWDNGKPVSRKGISQCFKYIRLEQYEDTLNNLEVNDSFGKHENESYVLRYMLDTETRDSLINTKDFVRPFDYTIKTTRDNELVDTPVDLVDTFNYLVGLHVESIRWHKDDNICVVEGTTHIEKEHALVIWRNQDVIKNDDLNDFFRKQDYSTLDREFDVIYVNGDNTLPNIKSDDEHWKVRLIEQELMKRMFEEV